MSEPPALVEHFFRHKFGRLVAVLTRCFVHNEVWALQCFRVSAKCGNEFGRPTYAFRFDYP
jgi:hypothetical protein